MDIKNLGIRTLSGIIYCLIIIICVISGPYGVLSLGILLSILACIEFAIISHDMKSRNIPTLIIEIAGCVCLCFAFVQYSLIIWIALMMMRTIEELYIKSERPLHNLAHSFMSQTYIGLPMALMTMMAFENNYLLILAIFLLIWINDTGAFLVGCSIGRHRLFERISPKKSWEGFFGGLVFSIGASIIFYYFGSNWFDIYFVNSNIWIWIGLGVIVTVFSTWGDLIESMIKRNLHIKDSGKMIPGHGGILDRIDSLLLVLPAVFIYITLLMASAN